MLEPMRFIVGVLARRFRSRAVVELETSLSVISCTFFAANDPVGSD
jgi:nitrate/nitrite transporter NarK